MSRDKRGNRTQEVVGSIPISSTKTIIPKRGRKTALLFARLLQSKQITLARAQFRSRFGRHGRERRSGDHHHRTRSRSSWKSIALTN